MVEFALGVSIMDGGGGGGGGWSSIHINENIHNFYSRHIHIY